MTTTPPGGNPPGYTPPTATTAATTTTTTARTTAPRNRWWLIPLIVVAAVIVLALIAWAVVKLAVFEKGVASSPAGATTAGPTTAAPTSAAASSSAPPDNCVSLPTNPEHQIGVTLSLNADDRASVQELRDLRGSKYTSVMYNGDTATGAEMKAWVGAATCNGFSSSIEVDRFLNAMSDAQAKDFLTSIDTSPHLDAYAVSMNQLKDGATDPVQAVNDRVKLIKSVSSKPVIILLDFFNTEDPADGVKQAQAYKDGVHLPVYLPWQQSDQYGPVSDYPKAGQQAVAVDGPGAWAAVQAFDWQASEPDTASDLGFTKTGLPSAAQVGEFAGMVHQENGVKNVLVYTEEPAADDTDYLRAVGDAVAAALNSK